ncbi:hypothetical protein CHH83_08485 [Bacillus sp. 7586-K]|nr:hypothetical protein CHH83_08485 [Bacillus sp. 7586-K]
MKNKMETSTSTYYIELNRWGITNNGSFSINNSKGINDALMWASQNGFTKVIFPHGTYVINETTPIEPASNMTIDLNGSTLKINENGLSNYSIICYKKNQKYSTITNGIIMGDKDQHNYSSGGSHEGGHGIEIGTINPPSNGGNNTKYVRLTNLEILNCTGDAIILNSTFGQISPFPSLIAKSWEQGSISPSNGSFIVTKEKIRSTLVIDLTQTEIVKYGYFGLYGNGFGNLGADIVCDFYDVIFYSKDNTFHSSKQKVQFFDEVEVPLGAAFARVVLHQTTIPDPNKCLINIRVATFPQQTFIERCNLHHCRRQGISLCGTKQSYIRENHIHHIGGTSPQSGIDIEDGYDLNQNIYIESNQFHNNSSYDILVVNGKSIHITKNQLTNTVKEGVSLSINGGADKIFVTENTFHKAKITLSGNSLFSNNFLYATQLHVLGKYQSRPILISDNLFHNSKLISNTDFPYIVTVDGCRFYNDIDKLNAFSEISWTLELKNQPQIISNCIFEGKDTLYNTYVLNNAKGGWLFSNTIFNNGTILVGKYINCIFQNDFSTLRIMGTSEDSIELINCTIKTSDRFNSLLSVNNIKSFTLKDCYIEKPNGTVLNVGSISESVTLVGNTIKISDDHLLRPLILLQSSYSGKSIIIENNTLDVSNLKQIGIENATSPSTFVVIRNNILNNASIKYNGTEIRNKNIIDGLIDKD